MHNFGVGGFLVLLGGLGCRSCLYVLSLDGFWLCYEPFHSGILLCMFNI